MGRHKLLVPKICLNLWFPLDVRARLDLTLVSELEGKVPKGSYSEFFTERTKEYLDWPVLQLEAFGFPPGFFVKGPKEMIEKLKAKLETADVT